MKVFDELFLKKLSKGSRSMITLIVWILVALAIICLTFAYIASRNDAAVSAARFATMTKRVQTLSDAVKDFRGAVKKDFEGTDDNVVVAAERTMDVLKDAIHKEAVIVQSTLGENRRAIVALGQLLSKSTQSLRSLLKTLDTEDKAQVIRMINEMEGRHAEIVQYLSGGDMDAAVKNILAELEKDPAVLKAESFSTEKLRTALRAYGVDMDDAALTKLNADLESDVMTGMNLKDSLYLRMSRIEPIATLSRNRGDQKKVEAETKVASAFDEIQAKNASHNEAIKGAIADQYMTQKINAAEIKKTVTTQLAASDAATKAKMAETTSSIKKTVEQSVAGVADMKAKVESELQKVEAMKLALSKVAPNVVPAVATPAAPAPASIAPAVAAGKLIEQKYKGYYNDDMNFFTDARKDGASTQVTTIKKGDEGSQYSYKWVGKIKPRASGDHEFWTRSDDASHVRINGRVVVDNAGVHGAQDKSGRLDLNADTTYDIEVFYGQGEGAAEMWLQWHGPGQGWQTDMAQILV